MSFSTLFQDPYHNKLTLPGSNLWKHFLENKSPSLTLLHITQKQGDDIYPVGIKIAMKKKNMSHSVYHRLCRALAGNLAPVYVNVTRDMEELRKEG
jgi:hypothetical protein